MKTLLATYPTMTIWNCRVCGLGYDESPWGIDDHTPDFTFCECCGAEFGYNDHSPESARRHRARWMENGAGWHYPNLKPLNWLLEPQLAAIPVRYQ